MDRIRARAAEMSSLVESSLKTSLKALLEGSRRAAYGVILRDQLIDELEMELNQLCLEFLARQQPVAGQLRFTFAMIQINRELERIGDYAESVARQGLILCDTQPQPDYTKVSELGDLAVHMLHDAMQAFLKQDSDLATRTMAVEERANNLRNVIMAEISRLTADGKLSQATGSALSTVARRLERASDQAKNICEEVLYMCTGTFAKHRGADKFRILFVDSHNATTSQLAEAAGKNLRRSEFAFASAGISPQALDPAIADFLRTKGVDAGALSSKSVEQLSDAAQYLVVVSLGKNLRDALPTRSGKMIHLTWPVPELPAGADPQRLEETWSALQAQIRDLVEAIMDSPNRPQPA